MLEQVISMNNHKEYISKDPNITHDIHRKCREKLEIIQHITTEYRALAEGDYTNRYSHVADISQQELVIKC
jgi:nicotinamide riboside kinase